MIMLRRIVIFCTAAVQLLAFSPDTPIAELKLNNGTVLHQVKIVGFSNSALTARWQGGRGTITYAEINDDLLAEMRDFIPVMSPQRTRPPAPQPPAAETQKQTQATASSEPTEKGITVTGTAFAPGVDQPYIFSGMTVALYPRAAAQQAMLVETELPAPVATALTDVKGEFTLTEKEVGDYLLIAQAERQYRFASNRTRYRWLVPVHESKEITLSSDSAEVYVVDPHGYTPRRIK